MPIFVFLTCRMQNKSNKPQNFTSYSLWVFLTGEKKLCPYRKHIVLWTLSNTTSVFGYLAVYLFWKILKFQKKNQKFPKFFRKQFGNFCVDTPHQTKRCFFLCGSVRDDIYCPVFFLHSVQSCVDGFLVWNRRVENR